MATAALRHGSAGEPVPAEVPMWYDKPAERWLQALPVGNGRLGAMVFGGAAKERLHLTESTLWSGAASTVNVNPAAREHLPAIRELLFAGKHTEAEELCGKYLLGRADQFGTALPLGFLELETLLTAPPVQYRRSLDLAEGVAQVAFASGGVRFRREVLASHPHGVIAVRLECDKPAGLSCTVAF
jgi:alpha-L-fucosidase 2